MMPQALIILLVVVVSGVAGWAVGHLRYRKKIRKLRELEKELEADVFIGR